MMANFEQFARTKASAGTEAPGSLRHALVPQQPVYPSSPLGIHGFAPDEHLSGTQPNNWSRHESPQQKKRRKEPRGIPLFSQKFISSKPKANPMQPALPRLNRTQSTQIHRVLMGISSPNILPRYRTRTGQCLDWLHRFASAGNIQKRPIVKLHSVFLRSECALPDRLDLCLQPIGESWSVVEEIPALVFDNDDPPGWLAFHVAAGCLLPKGHWVIRVDGRVFGRASLASCRVSARATSWHFAAVESDCPWRGRCCCG